MDAFTKVPTACDENVDPNPFWAKGRLKYTDSGDRCLPSTAGFINDVVYANRGCEVPTSFAIWSALYAISSLVKREVWVRWGSERLYTNFYTLLVGTAGLVKKSTSILRIARSMRDVAVAYDDMRTIIETVPEVRRDSKVDIPQFMAKRFTLFSGKITMEALLNAMVPDNKAGSETIYHGKDESGEWVKDQSGRAKRYEVPKTSEIALAAPEMSMLLGKQKYNEGLVSALLDLYDPHDYFEWETMARGKVILRAMHTTLIAGTTIAGFKSSVAESAIGDGFVSRSVLCNEEDTAREFKFPMVPEKAPTPASISERLIWITHNSKGEYAFTPEAERIIDTWYREHKKKLRKNMDRAGARSRMDITLYKVALLMRLQRYERMDNFIHSQDVEDALNLIGYTYKNFDETISEVAGQDFTMYLEKLKAALEDEATITRQRLARRFNRIPMRYLNICLEQLVEQDRIEVRRNDKKVSTITSNSSEVYIWKGDTD